TTIYAIVTKVVRPPMTSAASDARAGAAGAWPLAVVMTESCSEHRLEIALRPRRREVEIRFAQRVDERADHVRAADGRAACGSDVSAEPIQEHDLSIKQDDGDLRPVLGMRRTPPPPFRRGGIAAF